MAATDCRTLFIHIYADITCADIECPLGEVARFELLARIHDRETAVRNSAS